MDIANKVEFYIALVIGIPTVLLSIRCIFILMRKEYRKHVFCKIFAATLVFSSLEYILLMHSLRFAGQGFFLEYYEAVAKAWWQPHHSWLCRVCYMLCLMSSFALSMNRVTALYLNTKLVEKIWKPFSFLYLPLMIIAAGVLYYDIIVNRAEYVQAKNSDGSIYYQFMNYGLTRGWNSYYMMLECALDLICNVLIILKFVKLRMGQFKRTAFENSLYLISFASFFTHTVTTGIQIVLRYNLVPPSMLSHAYFVSNTFLDITVLLPTIAILALTKEIRSDVKRFIFSLLRCFKGGEVTPVTTTKITPSTQSVYASH